MKAIICISAIFTFLFFTGCSTTTYVSLTENNKELIVQKLRYDDQDENVGAEITLLQKNAVMIKGELLSVREYSVTICTIHSATEVELANMTHPITTILNEEIQEITVEGNAYFWSGMGYGSLGGAALGVLVFYMGYQADDNPKITEPTAIIIGGVLGALSGAIVGGIIGAISNDDIILQDIPPGYDLSILKPLARYPREEPEYLQAIE